MNFPLVVVILTFLSNKEEKNLLNSIYSHANACVNRVKVVCRPSASHPEWENYETKTNFMLNVAVSYILLRLFFFCCEFDCLLQRTNLKTGKFAF